MGASSRSVLIFIKVVTAMTQPVSTYSIVLTPDDSKPGIVQQQEMQDDILDLATVLCEGDVEVSRDGISAAAPGLTLTLHCREDFTAHVKNTVGVAAVKKSTVPHVAPAWHHC